MGKPVNMQIPALLGNDPGELPEDSLLPALPYTPAGPPPCPWALTSGGRTLSFIVSSVSHTWVNPSWSEARVTMANLSSENLQPH